MPQFSLEFKFGINNLLYNIIIFRVIEGCVLYTFYNLKYINNIEDYASNIIAKIPVFVFGDTEHNFNRFIIFYFKKTNEAVEKILLPRSLAIKRKINLASKISENINNILFIAFILFNNFFGY